MSRELFGTDGVRGLAGSYPLDSQGAYKIGMSVGTHFAAPGKTVVIGQDPRESSDQIVADLTRGLNDVGVNVSLVGVITTPGLAYLTREHDEFVAGVMITASHNSYQYNGVKVFDNHGYKLADSVEDELNQLIESQLPKRGNGTKAENYELIKEYEDFLVACAEGLQLTNLRLAIDTANGAASGLAERVFTRLGAQVNPLFDQPDGRNINAECGATNTAKLRAAVTDKQLDLGIAVDGDADRLIMVDDIGREVKGDYILYLLAVSMGETGVVATEMSNMGFEQALNDKDIKLIRTAVGDRYVLEGLSSTGLNLGGEQSGHIIIRNLLATGDALLAAVCATKALAKSSKTLASWCDEVKLVPQALVNVELSDKTKLSSEAVKAFITEQSQKLKGSGRLLIRASGTEPLARVMVEAPDAQNTADTIANQLKEILSQ